MKNLVVTKIRNFAKIQIGTESQITVGVLISLNDGIVSYHNTNYNEETYLLALLDLLNGYAFKKIIFVVAGTLQRYNLIATDKITPEKAILEMKYRENEWIKKYKEIVHLYFPSKKIEFISWDYYINDTDFETRKKIFETDCKLNINLKNALKNSITKFINRRHEKLSLSNQETEQYFKLVENYFCEEVPVIVDVLMCGAVDFILYPGDIPEIIQQRYEMLANKKNSPWCNIALSKRPPEHFAKFPIAKYQGVSCGRKKLNSYIISYLERQGVLSEREFLESGIHQNKSISLYCQSISNTLIVLNDFKKNTQENILNLPQADEFLSKITNFISITKQFQKKLETLEIAEEKIN